MTEIEVSHNWSSDQWDWPLQHHDGVVKLHNTPNKWEVALDAAYFTPNEIEVKVLDRSLFIDCHHALRTDEHGTVTRDFSRTYHIPADVNVKTIHSHLGQNGILSIMAMKEDVYFPSHIYEHHVSQMHPEQIGRKIIK